jgi:hypothetical protein
MLASSLYFKIEEKVVPVLAMKSRGITPLMLYLGTTWS